MTMRIPVNKDDKKEVKKEIKDDKKETPEAKKTTKPEAKKTPKAKPILTAEGLKTKSVTVIKSQLTQLQDKLSKQLLPYGGVPKKLQPIEDRHLSINHDINIVQCLYNMVVILLHIFNQRILTGDLVQYVQGRWVDPSSDKLLKELTTSLQKLCPSEPNSFCPAICGPQTDIAANEFLLLLKNLFKTEDEKTEDRAEEENALNQCITSIIKPGIEKAIPKIQEIYDTLKHRIKIANIDRFYDPLTSKVIKPLIEDYRKNFAVNTNAIQVKLNTLDREIKHLDQDIKDVKISAAEDIDDFIDRSEKIREEFEASCLQSKIHKNLDPIEAEYKTIKEKAEKKIAKSQKDNGNTVRLAPFSHAKEKMQDIILFEEKKQTAVIDAQRQALTELTNLQDKLKGYQCIKKAYEEIVGSEIEFTQKLFEEKTTNPKEFHDRYQKLKKLLDRCEDKAQDALFSDIKATGNKIYDDAVSKAAPKFREYFKMRVLQPMIVRLGKAFIESYNSLPDTERKPSKFPAFISDELQALKTLVKYPGRLLDNKKFVPLLKKLKEKPEQYQKLFQDYDATLPDEDKSSTYKQFIEVGERNELVNSNFSVARKFEIFFAVVTCINYISTGSWLTIIPTLILFGIFRQSYNELRREVKGDDNGAKVIISHGPFKEKLVNTFSNLYSSNPVERDFLIHLAKSESIEITTNHICDILTGIGRVSLAMPLPLGVSVEEQTLALLRDKKERAKEVSQKLIPLLPTIESVIDLYDECKDIFDFTSTKPDLKYITDVESKRSFGYSDTRAKFIEAVQDRLHYLIAYKPEMLDYTKTEKVYKCLAMKAGNPYGTWQSKYAKEYKSWDKVQDLFQPGHVGTIDVTNLRV